MSVIQFWDAQLGSNLALEKLDVKLLLFYELCYQIKFFLIKKIIILS